jgi:hypothetical protein
MLSATTVMANNSVENLMDSVEISGFECADKSLSMLGYLGRGTHFPEFLITDVETELKRQHAASQLVKVECTGEPEILSNSLPIAGDPSKNLLSTLSMTFPLNVQVRNAGTIMDLKVDQNYTVEGMDGESGPILTQNFVIKP